ncbi:MAG: serine protease [Planctomycetaceae bacterium]
MRRACHAVLLALACIAGVPGSARADGVFAGWGLSGAPDAAWDPAAFADYMLTGQPPHPALARIIAPEGEGTSMGSGVLVDVNASQGLVLTNWHVVRGAKSAVLVQFPDGFQSAGTVVRVDEAWDLAAVVIWKPTAAPVSLAGADPVPGELLTIAGFGRGAYREQTGQCTEYLSPGEGHPKEFVELEARARQGDSGGAIFNERRELAGVLFGQAEGRTIGSCSSRVRAFLASAGSSGFTPLTPAAYAAARAVEPAAPEESQTAAVVLAGASADESIQRSMHVPVAVVAPPHLPAAPQTDAWGQFTQSAGPTALRMARVAASDGQMLLTAAGGMALVVLGLRVLCGGRRREA